MCETCEQYPMGISRSEFEENAVQTPICPECGRTVPAEEAWKVYEDFPDEQPEPVQK